MPLRIRVPQLGTGSSVTNYTLTAATGTFAITGVAAVLRYAHKLPASAGSFAITGVAAGLKVGYKLPAVVGAYTITGVDATLRYGHVLTAAAGAFTITGVAATLTKSGSYVLTGDTGVYTITGQDADFRYFHLTAEAGSFVITGNAANLNYSSGASAYEPARGGGGGLRERGGRGSAKIRSSVTEDELRDAYERAMGLKGPEDAPSLSRTALKKVRKAVNAHAVAAALQGSMAPPDAVDWASVAQDMRAVDIILAAVARLQAEDEDAVIALLLAS